MFDRPPRGKQFAMAACVRGQKQRAERATFSQRTLQLLNNTEPALKLTTHNNSTRDSD